MSEDYPSLEYIERCFWCDGAGERKQMYNAGCDAGYYYSTGPCDHCRTEDDIRRGRMIGRGYLYKHNHKPVPDSVLEQIKCLPKKIV